MDDVPGEVELGAQPKRYVGEEVDEFVDVVHGGGLSTRQFEHQPQVQSDTVDLHKESDYSAGYIQLSVEGVEETPDHLRRRWTQGERWRCLYSKHLLSCICFYSHLPYWSLYSQQN